jgi:hypothetical protein
LCHARSNSSLICFRRESRQRPYIGKLRQIDGAFHIGRQKRSVAESGARSSSSRTVVTPKAPSRPCCWCYRDISSVYLPRGRPAFMIMCSARQHERATLVRHFGDVIGVSLSEASFLRFSVHRPHP